MFLQHSFYERILQNAKGVSAEILTVEYIQRN